MEGKSGISNHGKKDFAMSPGETMSLYREYRQHPKVVVSLRPMFGVDNRIEYDAILRSGNWLHLSIQYNVISISTTKTGREDFQHLAQKS